MIKWHYDVSMCIIKWRMEFAAIFINLQWSSSICSDLHQSAGNPSVPSYKGQWCGAFIFNLLFLWTNCFTNRQFNGYFRLRCSWSIACRRCSNYIFIVDLTPGFSWLDKDNCETRREIFKFLDLMRLVSEVCVHVLPFICKLDIKFIEIGLTEY